jgi:ribonuclease P protein component
MPKAFGYPPSIRLRKQAEIDTVFRAGRYHRMGWLQAKVQPNGREASRFMVSVSRRAGPAPLRNRVKRVVREAVRLNRRGLKVPHDVCLFVSLRPPARVRLADVEPALRRLFGRLARPSDAPVLDR